MKGRQALSKTDWPIRLDRRSWLQVAVASVGGLVSGLCGAALVALIGEAAQAGAASTSLAVAFAALCLLHFATKVGTELALMQVAQMVVLRLRLSLSRKLLATPLRRLQAMGNGELLAILTEDLATFAHCAQLLPVLFCHAVVVLVCLGWLAWLAWPVCVALLVFFALAGGGFHWAQQGPARRLVEVREQTDVLYRDLRSLVEGSKQLQLNPGGARHFLQQVLHPGAELLRRRFVAGMSGYIWIGNLGSLQFLVAIGLALYAVPRLLPEHAGSLPTLTVMLLYLAQPIGALLTAVPALRQGLVALRKAQQLDDALDEHLADDADTGMASAAGATDPAGPPPAGRAAQPVPSPFGHGPATLTLRGVTHAHEHGFAVGPVDMVLPAGQVSFIVGPNGSGKTTLALLLLGLYTPDAGQIALNGVAVTAQNLMAYRSQFSAVFADFHLFEQLLAPADATTTARAERYLQRLEMDRKVSLQQGSFSTLALSTGQRKRLALLVAYLEDRPIYLFDEWASDQDPVFKRLFYTELLPELRARGKTVIVITHDDQYFAHADQVIELREGQTHATACQPA